MVECVGGVICNRKVSARMKARVYALVLRRAMYDLETRCRQRHEPELDRAELRMLRFALEETRMSILEGQCREDCRS